MLFVATETPGTPGPPDELTRRGHPLDRPSAWGRPLAVDATKT